jgi:glutathionylspermidine synthase
MEIQKVTPKADFVDWLKRDVEYDISDNPKYIDPDIVVSVTEESTDKIEDAAKEMYRLCMKAVQKVIDDDRFAEFGIGKAQAEYIRKTWNRNKLPDGTTRDPGLAGRMDFCWDGKDDIKFYEFNADTYTTAYECAVVQWKVVEDLMKRGVIPEGMSQFNSLEEKLQDRLAHIRGMAHPTHGNRLDFTCFSNNEEDLTTTNYLRYLAGQAGWETAFVDAEQMGVVRDPSSRLFGHLFGADDRKIETLYKLVPWEHVADDKFAPYLERDNTLIIEPAWKAILSNKRLSVLLWEMFPGHPLLLPTYATPEKLGSTYVEKPIFGRVGMSIKTVIDGKVAGHNEHIVGEPDYSGYPRIYQQFHPLPELPGASGWRFQTGIWVVGDGQIAGMDLRRDRSLVTGSNDLRFVPHYMIPRETGAPAP